MSSVLIVAQPFGFWPAAVASKLSKLLRGSKVVSKLGYVGVGHTLDLQSQEDYHHIEKCGIDTEEERTRFKTLCSQYDLLLSVCDFDFAHVIKSDSSMKIPVVVHDCLPWFWPTVHPVVPSLDLYLAQDFFGVRERLLDPKTQQPVKPYPPNTLIIPSSAALPPLPALPAAATAAPTPAASTFATPTATPLPSRPPSPTSATSSSSCSYSAAFNSPQPAATSKTEKSDLLLINFGGLLNPLWSDDVLRQYVEAVLGVLRDTLFSRFSECVILCSRQIAQLCENSGFDIQTRDPLEAAALLRRAKLAFMTPGLGNMYDAAFADASVIWLPPTNATQGLQIRILCENDESTAYMDWHQFIECEAPITYGEDEVSVKVLQQTMENFATNKSHIQRFEIFIRDLLHRFPNGSSPQVLKKFGSNGCEVAAELVIEKLLEMAEQNN